MGLGRLVTRAALAPFVSGSPGSVQVGTIGYPAGGWGSGGWNGGFGHPSGDEMVTGLPAAWRCLHILTDGIGALDLIAIDIDEADRQARTPKVLADPWPRVTPVEWRSMVVASLVMHGNAYLLPTDASPRDGYPRQLPIVHPAQVRVEVINGRPHYWLEGEIGRGDRYSELDVLHIRGFQHPGSVIGVGVIEALRRSLWLSNSLDRYQQNNLDLSSVPPVVIKVQRPEVSQEQAEDIQRRWMARHAAGSRIPAVLPSSIQVDPIGWTPEDAEFLKSKQHSAVEICWMFGIDPRLLSLSGGGTSITYANLESAMSDLVRQSYMPWTSRIESAMSRVIPRSYNARFDFTPLLRPTQGDRFANYKLALDAGFLTVDEVRRLENLGPLEDDQESVVHSPRVESFKQVNESIPHDSTMNSEVIA